MNSVPARELTSRYITGGGAVDFSEELGKMRERLEKSESENFNLKLELDNRNREVQEAEKQRRLTMDSFYSFDEDARRGSSSGSTLRDEADQLRAENMKLQRDLEEALEEAKSAEEAAAAARREAQKARAEAEELSREALLVHDSAERARLGVRGEIQTLMAERDEALQSAERNVAFRVEGLSLQVDALEDALEIARESAKSGRSKLQVAVKAEKAALAQVAALEAKVKDLECVAQKDGPRSHAADGDGCKSPGPRVARHPSDQRRIERLQSRLDAFESQENMRREAQLDRSPPYLPKDGSSDGLSVPGFQLYQTLVEIVDRAEKQTGNAGLPEDDSRPSNTWRVTVLNEMNDALRTLYTSTHSLEDKRVLFVEKYCKSLANMSATAPCVIPDTRATVCSVPSDNKLTSPRVLSERKTAPRARRVLADANGQESRSVHV